jgi:hypothetical protein
MGEELMMRGRACGNGKYGRYSLMAANPSVRAPRPTQLSEKLVLKHGWSAIRVAADIRCLDAPPPDRCEIASPCGALHEIDQTFRLVPYRWSQEYDLRRGRSPRPHNR